MIQRNESKIVRHGPGQNVARKALSMTTMTRWRWTAGYSVRVLMCALLRQDSAQHSALYIAEMKHMLLFHQRSYMYKVR